MWTHVFGLLSAVFFLIFSSLELIFFVWILHYATVILPTWHSGKKYWTFRFCTLYNVHQAAHCSAITFILLNIFCPLIICIQELTWTDHCYSLNIKWVCQVFSLEITLVIIPIEFARFFFLRFLCSIFRSIKVYWHGIGALNLVILRHLAIYFMRLIQNNKHFTLERTTSRNYNEFLKCANFVALEINEEHSNSIETQIWDVFERRGKWTALAEKFDKRSINFSIYLKWPVQTHFASGHQFGPQQISPDHFSKMKI